MTTAQYATQARTASGINLLLGLWLVASCWIFNYAGTSAGWDSVAVGALVFIMAVNRVSALVGSGTARVNIVLGLWTIAAPWIFGFAAGDPTQWNSVAVGIAITLLALWSSNATVLRDRQEERLAAPH